MKSSIEKLPEPYLDTYISASDEAEIINSIIEANKPPRPKDVTKDVTTFEAACKYDGKDPKTALPYATNTTDDDERYLNAVAMLNIIFRVWRGDWKADYSDSNQLKYYPYFTWKRVSSSRPSGFVFYVAVYVYDFADSGSGSRHVFPTREMAECAGRIFEKIYNVILTIEAKK